MAYLGGKRLFQKILFLSLFLFTVAKLHAQDVEDFYARMLEQEVEVVNPVKYPVVGFGAGIINFLGDVRYGADSPLLGSWAAKMNVSTLLGKSKQIKLNVSVLYGTLEGQDYAKSLRMNTLQLPKIDNKLWYPNSSFQTEIIEIATSVEYNFWQFLGTRKMVRPYVSLGAGILLFTPKNNYKDAQGNFYHFWDDGTVRLLPQNDPLASTALPVRMDNVFETDLKHSNLFEFKSVPPVTAVFPAEFGVDIYLSDRVYCRVNTSLHYSLTDLLDGFNADVAKRYNYKASKFHDMFLYTGLSLHLDLFSQAESFIVDRVFADIEDFDYEVFFADQDNDGVFDQLDECPDTPPNTPVDSVGCPFDNDADGVWDVRDKEPSTSYNTPVDDDGVELSDAGRTLPHLSLPPVLRSKMKIIPIAPIWEYAFAFEKGASIPDKFRTVDADGDGYISFDEVIHTVDDYFTGNNSFTPDDIYELNAFFFAQ